MLFRTSADCCHLNVLILLSQLFCSHLHRSYSGCFNEVPAFKYQVRGDWCPCLAGQPLRLLPRRTKPRAPVAVPPDTGQRLRGFKWYLASCACVLKRVRKQPLSDDTLLVLEVSHAPVQGTPRIRQHTRPIGQPSWRAWTEPWPQKSLVVAL